MKLRILAILTIFVNFVFSQNYHDTQGKFDVSSNGQATFTLPIAMPPSINNYGPKIDVNYTSGQMSGIAGQGWGINGISKITRINTRFDIDGFVDGVDFDDNDKLAIDGQRLIVKSGTYWADNTIYQTEFQSNLKIQQIGSGANITFLVTTPDGTKNWYGKYGSNTATDLISYCLVRTEDTDGNFINYNYSRPLNASLCIDNIQFSANTISNPDPINKITFYYDEAVRKEKSYINGTPIIKKEILKSIEVATNMAIFRKYNFTYTTDSDGYSRLVKYQEFNGNNEPANPIDFTYNQTNSQINIEHKKTNFSFDFAPSLIKFLGDFNGDNLTDALIGNTVVFNPFELNGENHQTSIINGSKFFQGKTLHENKLVQNNSIISMIENSDNLVLNVYNFERYLNSNFVKNYQKKIIYDNSASCLDICTGIGGGSLIDELANKIVIPNTNKCIGKNLNKTSNQYLEGDFNGDGLSEVLIFAFNENWVYKNIPDSNRSCAWQHQIEKYPSKINLIDLRENVSTIEGTAGNVSFNNYTIFEDGKRYVIDYNGDGKSDILNFRSGDSGYFKVIGFKQLLVAPWVEIEILGSGYIENYTEANQILFGDYNGDGKTDFMLPQGVCNQIAEPLCSFWHIYYANPNINNTNSFVKETKIITSYNPLKQYSSGQTFQNYYYSIDANKDGKSDLVRVETWLRNEHEAFWPGFLSSEMWVYEYKTHVFINNLGNSNVNEFSLEYSTEYQKMNENNIPLIINQRNNGIESEFMMFSYNNYKADFPGFYSSIDYINFNSNFQKNNQLSKVAQSEGKIIDEMYYSKLIGSPTNKNFGNGTDIYSSDNSLIYPFVEIKGFFYNEVISKLTNNTAGLKKSKNYSYKGMSINLHGVGFLGFRKSAQTNWYLDSDTKKTWSVTENDPLIRGAVKRNYSLLLSRPFNFEENHTNLISEVSYSYQTPRNISWPYYALLKKEKYVDYLTNVISEKEYVTYTPDYFLPELVTNKKYLGTILQGKTSVTTIYDDAINNDTTYVLGKPKEITSVSELYVNTPNNFNSKFSNEKLSYTNNRLTKTEKTANGSAEKIVEEFGYFPNGLLQSKIIKAENTSSLNQVDSRKTEYTYDDSNRYIKTVKDNDGLVTVYNDYDLIYGLVKKETNPFGKYTINNYDNWGKRIKITDFLGTKITYTYSKTNGIYKTLQIGDDGSASFIEQDVLSREIRKGTIDINGNWNYVNTEYDKYGRKHRISEPYRSTDSPSQWSVTEYDDYSRPIKQTAYTGKIVSTNYNGLTVTAAEPMMSKSKSLNALGFVISTTDSPGGTINNIYDANGNLLESDYEGIKTKSTFDQWNRKETYLDTSLGLFTYKYDAFGQMKSEISAKGKTEITYTSSGKLLTKSIVGHTAADVTNISLVYSYDSFFRLSKIDVTNPNDGDNKFEYFYDPITNQLNNTIETIYAGQIPIVTFEKKITFDMFGRENTEQLIANAYGKSSSKTLTYTYKNGSQWQILDGTNIKWQTDDINARGQLTKISLGNNITINNNYDNYGYLSQTKHNKGLLNVLQLNTVFDPVLGNLKQRTNNLFDFSENFNYDNLDRLISWESLGQNILYTPFNTTTEGFSIDGENPIGSVANVSGKLKLVLKGTSVFAIKDIATNVLPGEKLKISAEISNKAIANNTVVNAIMVEVDPNNPENTNEVFLTSINNGRLETYYQVSTLFSNPILKLKISIDPSSSVSTTPNLVTDPEAEPIILIPITSFYIDNLKIDNILVNKQNYDNKGRVTDNNLGAYSYNVTDGKPYQNNKIVLTTEGINYYSNQKQDITYNAFKGAINIVGNTDIISFGYNGFEQRNVMYWGSSTSRKTRRPFRKHYSADGSMEIKATFDPLNVLSPTSVEFSTFVGGNAYDAPIIVKGDGDSQSYFYLHRDYQGSIIAITNEAANIVEKRLFDPWGLLARIQDGNNNNLAKLTFFDRGYTGHEHLESVGLIHMNARLYDPKLHRFLQADNVLQDPNNTQNYNRYGYCFNNPLKFSDPSGNFIQIGAAIAIGVAVALATHVITSLAKHQRITLSGIMSTITVSAFTSAATFGIGEAFTGTLGNFYLQASVQAVAHGTLQGVMASAQGGKFWSSFAAGAISSIASSAWAGDATHQGASGYFGFKVNDGITLGGTLFFGTISGGAGAALTGGNFWQGAVTGLVVSGLNHAMHMVELRKDLKSRFHNIDPDAKPDFSEKGTQSLLNDVDGLREAYNWSGGNKKIDYDFTEDEGITITTPGKEGFKFNKNELTTNWKLASTMFHEFRHGLHYWGNSQQYSKWMTKFNNDIEKTLWYMERDSYRYELNMGSPSRSAIDGFNKYDGIIKRFENLNR